MAGINWPVVCPVVPLHFSMTPGHKCRDLVTAKGTGPQDLTGPESTWTWLHPQAALWDIPPIRRPCAQGSKSWHSASFAKYSDIGLVTISFPACCVSHRATGLPVMVHDMHTRRRRPDYLQATGMFHRTACGWSQVRIDSGPVARCGPVPFAVTLTTNDFTGRRLLETAQIFVCKSRPLHYTIYLSNLFNISKTTSNNRNNNT